MDANMERPNKRPRVSGLFHGNHLSHEIDVIEARKANDLRLKSRLEGIFAKYGRDFSSVGDEIDLSTGHIVVNNGHIEEMENEQDIGKISHGYQTRRKSHFAERQNHGGAKTMHPGAERPVAVGLDGEFDSAMNGKLSNQVHFDYGTVQISPPPSADPQPDQLVSGVHNDDHDDEYPPIDPLWRAPEIDGKFTNSPSRPVTLTPPLASRLRSASPLNAVSLWALPLKGRRKATRTAKTLSHSSVGESRGKRCTAETIQTPERSNVSRDSRESDDPLQENSPPVPKPQVCSSSERQNLIESREHQPTATKIKDCDCRKNRISSSEQNLNMDSTQSGYKHDDVGDIEHMQCSEQEGILEENGNVHSKQPGYRHERVHDIDDMQSPEQEATEATDPRTSAWVAGTDSNLNITEKNLEDLLAHNASSGLGHLGEQNSIPSLLSTQRHQMPRNIDPPVTPGEINTIVTSRILQKRPWRDVFHSLPKRRVGQLKNWYYACCIGLQTNPPENSSPWSVEERMRLNSIRAQSPVSWKEMQSMFQDRDITELQYEWIRTCVGEAAWQNGKHKGERLGQIRTPSKQPKSALQDSTSPKHLSRFEPKSLKQQSPQAAKGQGQESESESSDDVDPLTEAFDKAWAGSGLSTIQIDTPRKESTPKRQGFANVGVSPLPLRSRRKQAHFTP